ncbi:MAG: hypothetical protein ACRDCW_08665 [Sarcina sp.]
MSKVISIRLENELHKDLKRLMVDEETTFQEYVLELIKKDMSDKKTNNNMKKGTSTICLVAT